MSSVRRINNHFNQIAHDHQQLQARRGNGRTLEITYATCERIK